MNFLALKNMIEWLVKQHTCPSCNAHIDDANVDIMGAAGSTINLDLQCQECWNHSMIKSEIMSVKLTSEQVSALSHRLNATQKNKNAIVDEQIIELNKKLKQNQNISDLFDDSNS